MPPLDRGRISANQLIFLLLNFLIPFSLMSAVGNEAGHDAWLPLISGVVISLSFALLYLVLANRFRCQTLIAINDIIWGPYAGKFFSALFLMFLLFSASLATALTSVFQSHFLQSTPILVITLLTCGVAAVMVACGVEVIARCSQLIAMVLLLINGLLLLLIIPDFKLTNFQPMLQTPRPLLVKAALSVAAHSFGAGFASLMIFPLVRDYRRIYTAVIKAFTATALYYLIGFTFGVGSLGPTTSYYLYPYLQASRLINIGEVFSRMDVFTGITIWLWLFLYQTMHFYYLAVATGEFFKLRSHRALCPPLWILLSLLSVHIFESGIDLYQFALHAYHWLVFPFQYLLPLMTLLVAVIRKLPRRET